MQSSKVSNPEKLASGLAANFSRSLAARERNALPKMAANRRIREIRLVRLLLSLPGDVPGERDRGILQKTKIETSGHIPSLNIVILMLLCEYSWISQSLVCHGISKRRY